MKPAKSIALAFVVGFGASLLANVAFAWVQKRQDEARASAPLPGPIVPGFGTA